MVMARWPIARLLAVVLAGMVAVTAAAVLALTWGASLRNTFDFLNQRTVDLAADLMVTVDTQLLPAEYLAAETIAAIQQGVVDPTDQTAFSNRLMGGLSGAPQVRAIAVVKPDLTSWSVHWGEGRLMLETVSRASQETITKAFIDAAKRPPGPFWGELVHVQNSTLINLRATFDWPAGGKGMLVVVISLHELSGIFADQNRNPGWTSFILYGHSQVLAHPYLREKPEVLTQSQPLLPLSILPDPVLRVVWDGDTGDQFGKAAETGTEVRFASTDGPSHIYVLKKTERFGDVPWYVGAYTDLSMVNDEYERSIRSGLVSLVLVALAIVVAIIVGHRLARPLRRTAIAATQIGRLQLEGLEPLPGSRVWEFDQQATAFNQMAEGLRAFSTYVPKQLVGLLAARGFRADLPPISTEATILFTDIVGFTTQTEHLSAEDTAAFLNHYFSVLGDAVHEEGGIVDKYIGDSLMAFWAPPLSDQDGAARAMAAARKITEHLAIDNKARGTAGLAPVRIRVGIHTGPALVGNIGAAGRMNYTIVDDTVNVAQRLQEYGRNVNSAAECLVLASGETMSSLPMEVRGTSLGPLPIRGREADIIGWRI
jgi:adenylate cyclase